MDAPRVYMLRTQKPTTKDLLKLIGFIASSVEISGCGTESHPLTIHAYGGRGTGGVRKITRGGRANQVGGNIILKVIPIGVSIQTAVMDIYMLQCSATSRKPSVKFLV